MVIAIIGILASMLLPSLSGARSWRELSRLAREKVQDGEFEEANELLEATDAALMAWQRERNQPAHVAELQRHLHTLKGGARMAGITPMGDLSHEMETLLTEVVDGRLKVTTEMFALAQRSAEAAREIKVNYFSSDGGVKATCGKYSLKRSATSCGISRLPAYTV